MALYVFYVTSIFFFFRILWNTLREGNFSKIKKPIVRLRKGNGNSRKKLLGLDNLMLSGEKLSCLAKSEHGVSTLVYPGLSSQ